MGIQSKANWRGTILIKLKKNLRGVMTSVSQVFVVSLPFLDKLFYILQCVFFKQFQPNKIFKNLKKKNQETFYTKIKRNLKRKLT